MRTILIGLALVTIIALLILVALLAVMRAGIRHQERAACLICHPPGLTAAIARHLLRMQFRAPDRTHECRHANRGPALIPNNGTHFSAKRGAAS
jgi:hypothetical protein